MDDQGQQDFETLDLREYIAILKARRWTIVTVAAIVTALAIGFSAIVTPRYTSEARVLVEAPAVLGDPLAANMETERQIVDSEPVAALARTRLGSGAPLDELLEGLTVSAPPEATVLVISYTATDPELARDAADAFAQSYIAFKRQRRTADFSAEAEALEERLLSAQQQLTELTDEIEEAERSDDDSLESTLENNRTALIARIGVLQQRLDDLQATRGDRTVSGEVIEAASLPTDPSSPNYVTNAILGLLLGIALGIGLAFLRERLDDRFRGREDVERVTQAPVLATIPRFKSGKRPGDLDPITVRDPKSLASEAYRGLRTNLMFIAATRNLKSVVVTSALAAEGKSVTIANLALVLADAGSRVILVSADLRKPTLERQLGLERAEQGLSTWLATETGSPPWALLRDPKVKNLRLLPCGAIPPNPAELLSSPRFRSLVAMLEDNADMVLFDSPPVLAVSDASTISTHVGGTLLVVDASSTHRGVVAHTASELNRVNGTLVGTSLNSFDPSNSPYYYGPYLYNYGEATPPGNGSNARRSLRRPRFSRFGK